MIDYILAVEDPHEWHAQVCPDAYSSTWECNYVQPEMHAHFCMAWTTMLAWLTAGRMHAS